VAISYDITEDLPYPLSNPASAKTYQSDGELYDISINGKPFFAYITDEFPYRRQTAPYRKQQVDQSNEPGEQTLTGWWLRSQSSFHHGDGIKFYDPSAGETVSYRFADSKGVNVWTNGQVTLLKSCTPGHITTGAIRSNGRPFQFTRSITWSGTNGILNHDEYDVDKIAADGTVTHFIDYNAGSADPVYAICDDGTYAYWVTNKVQGGSNKLHLIKKPLTGSSASTADETTMFYATGIATTNAVMEYVKERLILIANNSVYELSTAASALPTALYTHPNTNYVYTSITASGPAVYIAGYNGIQSTIQKFTLSSTGALPTLTSASVAAELPVGEIVYKIYYYLGYMMIGTNKGVRAALVSDQDGSISYGPLIVETSQPCFDFAAQDKYVWCATSVDGDPGLIRINLGNEIEQLRFSWANDVYYGGITNHQTTSCAFIAGTNRISFTTAYYAGANGYVYIESATDLVSSGYIQTGKIRYSTLEEKIFKILRARINNADGGLSVATIDSAGNEYAIATFAQQDYAPEINIAYPTAPQEFISLKFTLSRFTTDATRGPIFNGYQLKSLPAVPRQRMIQYPLACWDIEADKNGVQVGHEDSAYDRVLELEDVENAGDTIRVDDLRTGESFVGIIEEISFLNRTPSGNRFSGFGGVLLVTIRTL
jgi:hypothetical protein